MNRTALALGFGLVLATASLTSTAKAADSQTQQAAGQHFERGVALYGEADYRGALTEFKRAYELAPSPLVLYNIGQAHFQLRNYSAALSTFERYLAEAGANAPHEKEVEQSVATLKTRVGRIDIESNVPADVQIDDEAVGKTPLSKLLVSVGRHRIVATREGSPPQERTIEVAAGDALPVKFAFDASVKPTPGPSGPLGPTKSDSRPPYATIAWVTTGALAAGAIVTGVVATTSSSSLSDERDSATATRDRLDSLSGRAKGFALATDILGAAAIVAGAAAIYFTVTRPKGDIGPKAQVGVAPAGFTLRLTY